jgi:hypothetical protein
MTQAMPKPTRKTPALILLGLGAALLLTPVPARSEPLSGNEDCRLLVQTVPDASPAPAPTPQATPGACASGSCCDAQRKVRLEMARLAALLERQRVEAVQTEALLQQARERLAEVEKQAQLAANPVRRAGASDAEASSPEKREGAVRTPPVLGEIQQRLLEMDRKLDVLLGELSALQQEVQSQRSPTLLWQGPASPRVEPTPTVPSPYGPQYSVPHGHLHPPPQRMPPAPDSDPRATPTLPLTTPNGDSPSPSR